MVKNQVRQNVHSKIYLVALVAIAFILPLYKMGPSIPTVLLLINWLIEGDFQQKWQRAKKITLIGFIGYFIVTVMGLLYTQNIDQGLIDIQLNLSFLIIPLVVLTSQPLCRNEYRFVLKAFIAGCLICGLIGMGYGLWHWKLSGSIDGLYYRSLIGFTNMHPSYVAMFTTFAIFIVLYELTFGISQLEKWQKLLYIGLLFILLNFTFLLASRAQIIVFFIVANVYLLYVFWQWQKILLGIAGILVINSLLLVGLMSTETTQKRFQVLIEPLTTTEDNHSLNPRFYIWSASIKMALKKPFFGYGSGDVADVLKEQFRRMGFNEGVKSSYNAHNQYLQSLLASGVFCLFFLLLILFRGFFLALKNNRIIYLLLIVLLAISFLAESMLESQSGVVFTAFMIALFHHSSPQK